MPIAPINFWSGSFGNVFFVLGLLYCKKVKNDICAGVGHPDELACSKEDGKVQHFFLQKIRNPYHPYKGRLQKAI